MRTALSEIDDDDGGSFAERCALIVKAWNSYANGKTITTTSLKLAYDTETDEEAGEEWRVLADFPVVGGVDVGEPDEAD